MGKIGACALFLPHADAVLAQIFFDLPYGQDAKVENRGSQQRLCMPLDDTLVEML